MNFLDKRTRINIMQSRANEYNEKFDELEQQGYDLDEIPQMIATKEKASKPILKETLPFEENTKVIGVGNAFQQGYQGSHKILSSTKQQYQDQDTFFRESKINPDSEKVKKFKEQQKKQQEVDKLSKQEIQKDHLTAMLNIGQKVPKSNYQHGYEFTNEFQTICDHQNFEYNYKKNDLKQYAEEYVRSKANLRK